MTEETQGYARFAPPSVSSIASRPPSLTSLDLEWDSGGDDENQKDVTIVQLSSDCFRGVADGECPGLNVQPAEVGNNFGRGGLRSNFGGTGGHFGGVVEGGERRVGERGEEEKTTKDSLTLDNQNCSVGIRSIPVSD